MTPDVEALLEGIRAQQRSAVSQAITLVESSKREHRTAARDLLTTLGQDPAAGVQSPAVRVGISGVPGVGKSTFIESLGTRLTGAGHRVGVLAVDPSSIRTGGSVLGDKTRMARLSAEFEIGPFEIGIGHAASPEVLCAATRTCLTEAPSSGLRFRSSPARSGSEAAGRLLRSLRHG